MSPLFPCFVSYRDFSNVQSHVGDPERITAYGLSTGGAAISLHTMAYGGERGVPFQQAWIISGPPNIALNITSDVTAFHTLAVAEMSGCGDLSDSEMINCLRKLSMRSLLDTATEYSILNNPPGGLFTFFPSVDEDFIPDSLSNLMQTGNFTKGMLLKLISCPITYLSDRYSHDSWLDSR